MKGCSRLINQRIPYLYKPYTSNGMSLNLIGQNNGGYIFLALLALIKEVTTNLDFVIAALDGQGVILG